jgi:two-component system cell cycle sensor histidine kinase PleC
MNDHVELLTRRYKRERSAREQAEALIEQKSLELYTAKMAAEFANRTKTQFIANISHELRTPLNAIIGFGELLHAQKAGELSELQLEYLNHVVEAGRGLHILVEQMIEVSRLDIGKRELNLERFDVKGAVTRCIEICRPRVEAAKLNFEFIPPDAPSALEGDRQAVKQILLNLLDNAIKFTPEGGSIAVSIRPDSHDRYEITVSDSGIGIARDHLDLITQPFYQVDGGLTRRREGSGLGLTIAKSLIDLHGGLLRIISTPGVGTKATAVLPRLQQRTA